MIDAEGFVSPTKGIASAQRIKPVDLLHTDPLQIQHASEHNMIHYMRIAAWLHRSIWSGPKDKPIEIIQISIGHRDLW
jgi:hypothetical protein